MSQPVGIVTGAASGIGLAVTKHLLSRGYRVVIADLNASEGQRIASELGPNALFHKTDVSSYSDQASLFSKAFEWGGNRLDFFHANAGIDDKQSLYATDEPLDEQGVPKPLNLITLNVCLNAVIQGIWLFKYYARKNAKKGGKVVITSSSAGIYPMATNPQYTAAKTALVGLTRAVGPVFLEQDAITVNAICPSFVPTNLCPPHVRDLIPPDQVTPMTTVLKAIDTFLDDDTMTGQTVELSRDQLYFQKQPAWSNESQRWHGEDVDGFWKKAYGHLRPVGKGK